MPNDKYREAMAANGKLGGLARGKKYEKIYPQIEHLFITTTLTQAEIAKKLKVSQAMVSAHMSDPYFKLKRLQYMLADKQQEAIKDQIDQDQDADFGTGS
jgi:predicted XRE-type DNA-binding protein